MKKRTLFGVMMVVAFCLTLFCAPMVSAKTCEGVSTALVECGEGESGIGTILSLVLNIMSAVIGILGTLGILIAGAQYMTARDNEEQIRKSKRRILEIVIGLVAYALFFALAQWLLPGDLNPSAIPHYDIPEGTYGDENGDGNDSSDGGTTKVSGGELIAKIARWAAWQNDEDLKTDYGFAQGSWAKRTSPFYRNMLIPFYSGYPDYAIRDCGYFVGTVVNYAKRVGLNLNDSFPLYSSQLMKNHFWYEFNNESEDWEMVSNKDSEAIGDQKKSSQLTVGDLMPGDIAASDGHVLIYVGNGRIAEANLNNEEKNWGRAPHMASWPPDDLNQYVVARYKKKVEVDWEKVCCGSDGKYCKSGSDHDWMQYTNGTCKVKRARTL